MNTALQAIGVFLLGGLAGALVNYLADILPLTRRFIHAPLCVYCHEPVPWRQYLLYRRCPQCGKRRSLRTWIVQAAFPLALLLFWLQPNARLNFWIGAGLIVYLGLVTVTDIEYRVILTPVSAVGALIGFAIGWALHGPWATLLGGVAGFGLMLLLYYGGELFARWVSKLRGQEIEEVALGFGDVNLGGILGLILGWPGITAGLLLGILIGGLAGVVYLVAARICGRYRAFSAIPYAPFLILGAALLLFRP